MPPQSKANKSAASDSHKNKGRSSSKRKQAAPDLPLSDPQGRTDEEEEPSLKALMEMMGKINARMATYKTMLGDTPSVPPSSSVTAKPSTSR